MPKLKSSSDIGLSSQLSFFRALVSSRWTSKLIIGLNVTFIWAIVGVIFGFPGLLCLSLIPWCLFIISGFAYLFRAHDFCDKLLGITLYFISPFLVILYFINRAILMCQGYPFLPILISGKGVEKITEVLDENQERIGFLIQIKDKGLVSIIQEPFNIEDISYFKTVYNLKINGEHKHFYNLDLYEMVAMDLDYYLFE